MNTDSIPRYAVLKHNNSVDRMSYILLIYEILSVYSHRILIYYTIIENQGQQKKIKFLANYGNFTIQYFYIYILEMLPQFSRFWKGIKQLEHK